MLSVSISRRSSLLVPARAGAGAVRLLNGATELRSELRGGTPSIAANSALFFFFCSSNRFTISGKSSKYGTFSRRWAPTDEGGTSGSGQRSTSE